MMTQTKTTTHLIRNKSIGWSSISREHRELRVYACKYYAQRPTAQKFRCEREKKQTTDHLDKEVA